MLVTTQWMKLTKYTVLVLCESSNAVITRFPLQRTWGIKYFNSQSCNSSSPRSRMRSIINIYFFTQIYLCVGTIFFCRLKSVLEAANLPTIAEIQSFTTTSSSRFFLAFKWHLPSGQWPWMDHYCLTNCLGAERYRTFTVKCRTRLQFTWKNSVVPKYVVEPPSSLSHPQTDDAFPPILCAVPPNSFSFAHGVAAAVEDYKQSQ